MTLFASLDLKTKKQPHVLTIAGSDSGGGAGIQADIKTIAAFGCYASSVITALTAQNTLGVQAVHNVPAEFVIKQLESIFNDDMIPLSIKFGMLASARIISTLAQFFAQLPTQSRPYLILDPVMISTSGHALLPDEAVDSLRSELLPLVDMVTPNIPEAFRLSAQPTSLAAPTSTLSSNSSSNLTETINSVSDIVNLARRVKTQCQVPTVLLKGGHCPIPHSQLTSLGGKYDIVWAKVNDDDETIEVLNDFRNAVGSERKASKMVVVDVLIGGDDRVNLFVADHVESSSTHGTGCTLSAALASCYALEQGSNRSDGAVKKYLTTGGVQQAIEYTQSAIANAFPLGLGHGPLNHSHLTFKRALPPPTEHDPHPFLSHLIRADPALWKSYVRHPFVVQLGQGTLPKESFEHYIKQDYHYLRHYARAHALGGFKSSQFKDIKAFSEIALHIARESEMHVEYCSSFGISQADLDATPESAACAAYALYILDIGNRGDVLDLYVAVASCLVGYGEVGLWLQNRVKQGEAKLEGNLYKRWMEDYSGKDFLDAVRRGILNLERLVASDPPSPERLQRLTKIWLECVRLERDFWEMGLNKLW